MSILTHLCTAPPTNESTYNEWTIGSVFYSALVTAEVFGKSGNARIIDLNAPSPFTPAYAIYEGDTLSKFALFNYIDDPSGAHDHQTVIQVPDGGVPASVRVKYVIFGFMGAVVGDRELNVLLIGICLLIRCRRRRT